MYKIVNEFPHEIILEPKKGPFISIYQPTERHSANSNQDLLRFKNALRDVENGLKKTLGPDQVKKRMKPLEDLYDDRIFWNNSYDGVAVLADEEEVIIYKLNRSVEKLAVVSDSYYLKPLIRNFQSADRYHLLGFSMEEFVLYEGNRYGFEKIEFDDDIDTTADEVLGTEYTEPHLTVASYGGAGGTAMHHGHGGKKDEVDIDRERFFKYIDKIILDRYSNEERIPLILGALDENQGKFRKISNNKYLLENGINKDLDSVSKEDLRKYAWEILEPVYLEKTKKLVDRFEVARSQDMGSDDIVQVAKASIENRIDTILVEYGKQVKGKLDKETGKIIEEGLEEEFSDILNDITEQTLKFSGNVVVLPKERMPSDTGLAAIYRF